MQLRGYTRGDCFTKKQLDTTRAGRKRKILCACRAETFVSRFARALPERILRDIPRASGTEFLSLLSPSFAFPHPGRTPFSRPREQRNGEIPRNATRAPTIKGNRLRLHNPSVSTSPLPLLSAFPQTLPMREGTVLSRPDLHPPVGAADTRLPGELRSPAPRVPRTNDFG